MPYPALINPERILEKARQMVELEGADQLSLHRLAAELGVKAPSLYRYFTSKTDLLRALNFQTVRQLTASMIEAAPSGDHPGQLLALARTWRSFAHANPASYALAFTNPNPELQPDAHLLEGLAIPIQQVIAGISGMENSLAALRGLWALVHGFILLELSGQFRRGGNIDTAFEESIEAYLNGWVQDTTYVGTSPSEQP